MSGYVVPTERTYIYGWGRTKHILAYSYGPADGWRTEVAVCGAHGGRAAAPSRPTCKHCERIAALRDSGAGR